MNCITDFSSSANPAQISLLLALFVGPTPYLVRREGKL